MRFLIFNLGTLFTSFYGVSSGTVPVFIIIYALGNLAGPLVLGPLFDSVGRRPMIVGTRLIAAGLAVLLGILFVAGALGRWSFEAMLVATFFFTSAGASAAYLTVSEIFPMETRALAIAVFYAAGTAAGGIVGPLLFGHLIATKHELPVAIGFWIGAVVMSVGTLAEVLFGPRAERRSLEELAPPLTAVNERADEAPNAIV